MRNVIPTRKTKFEPENLHVLLMCAGNNKDSNKGTKSLFPCNNITLIEHQINCIRSIHPHATIVCVLGPEEERVFTTLRPLGVFSVKNTDYDKTSFNKSLAVGLKVCYTGNLLIVPNDVLFEPSLIDNLMPQCLTFLDTRKIIKQNKPGIIMDEKSIVRNISYGVNFPKWTQISFITGGGVEKLKKIVFDTESNQLAHMEIMNLFLSEIPLYGIETPKDFVEVTDYKSITQFFKKDIKVEDTSNQG